MANCKYLWSGLVLLTLTACATSTPYQPAANNFGYRTQQLEEDRFIVSFAGNSRTERRTVETYLLYRSAELTLEQGYDYFVLVEQDTDTDVRYYQDFIGFPAYGYYGYGHRNFGLYGAFGPGYGVTRAVPQYQSHAQIVLFQGEPPAGDLRAYDARQVVANLGPALRFPEAPAVPETPAG